MPDSEELRTEWCEGEDKRVPVKTEERSDGGDDEETFLQRRSNL